MVILDSSAREKTRGAGVHCTRWGAGGEVAWEGDTVYRDPGEWCGGTALRTVSAEPRWARVWEWYAVKASQVARWLDQGAGTQREFAHQASLSG